MTDAQPVSRRPERSNLWGAIVTLILETAVVATLAVVGLGISFLMLWLTG
jgi:hypothetical protein